MDIDKLTKEAMDLAEESYKEKEISEILNEVSKEMKGSLMKEILKRLKSPVVISGIVSILTFTVTMLGIEFKDITTWEILFENLVAVFTNPFILFSVLVQLFAFFNNPTNKSSF
jgi:hypothetical protein